MKIIQPAASLIDLVIGKRKYDTDVIYRPIHYLIFAETKDKKTLVHNNLTKSIILLDPSEYCALKSNDFSKHQDLKQKLVEMLFLVQEAFNEKETADSIRKIAKSIFPTNEITSYTILPTTSCNARCFYCYEAGTKFITMDENTAEAVAKYIVKNSNGKKVNIPSLIIKAGDVIAVKEKSTNSPKFKEIKEMSITVPAWMTVDVDKLEGKVVAMPTREEIDTPVAEHLIVELYSK